MQCRPMFKVILILLLGCVGCSKEYPEAQYIGTEHWVVYDSTDSSQSQYDLGSVRRIDDVVIFNLRRTIGTGEFLNSTPENNERQKHNFPLLFLVRMTVRFDCKKRTVASFNVVGEYEDGSIRKRPESKETLVTPGSSGERLFERLCGRQ